MPATENRQGHAGEAERLLIADADWRTGVVTHVNQEKKLTAVQIGRDDMVLLLHPQFPETATWAPGQPVRMAVEWNESRDRWQGLAVELSEDPPSAAFCRSFEGTLKQNADQRFAFVHPDGIFCPESVLHSVPEPRNGACVRGVAVLAYNAGRGEYGWKAVVVSPGA